MSMFAGKSRFAMPTIRIAYILPVGLASAKLTSSRKKRCKGSAIFERLAGLFMGATAVGDRPETHSSEGSLDAPTE